MALILFLHFVSVVSALLCYCVSLLAHVLMWFVYLVWICAVGHVCTVNKQVGWRIKTK
jgi:hypothetical protein